jgi:hypothetical protein
MPQRPKQQQELMRHPWPYPPDPYAPVERTQAIWAESCTVLPEKVFLGEVEVKVASALWPRMYTVPPLVVRQGAERARERPGRQGNGV